MKCEHAVDLIVDSLLDSLDDNQRLDLTRHIQTCPSCAAEAERMGALWEELGELPAPQATPRAGFDLGRRMVTARRYRRFAPSLLAAAAMALVFLGGVGGYVLRDTGGSDVRTPGATTFLFLVRGGELQTTISEDSVVREYQAWASSLAREGRFVGANKLMDEPGRWVASATAGETRTRSDVSGYFLLNASGYSEAVEIAGSSPHVRYGGSFEIRQVDSVN